MGDTVKLSRLDRTLERLSYPVSRGEAAERLDGVTVLLADGEEDLGDLLTEVGSDSFDSAGDLRDEIYEYLPEEAIGEPGQSEGEG